MATKKKSSAKKGAKKASTKKTVKRAAKKAPAKKKRTPNAAFMKPMQPDEALSAVVGSGPLPRTEITKKLWQYIKKNGLQDAKVRRNINADDKLGKVFGGKKQVSMFEMTKLVNKHIK
jgi:chromatin remodeling complex protein RSC6